MPPDPKPAADDEPVVPYEIFDAAGRALVTTDDDESETASDPTLRSEPPPG